MPNKLYEIFSGVKNSNSTVCNARIQDVYDLLSGLFIAFSIDSYSKNDLKAAPDIEVQEGDLILRDRGNFVLSCVKSMKTKRGDSIMRYKHKKLCNHSQVHCSGFTGCKKYGIVLPWK